MKGRRGGRWSRSLLALTAVLGTAAGVVAGFAVPAGTPRVAGIVEDLQLPDPIGQLERAEAATPYRIRLPSVLPEGAALLHADWSEDRDPIVSVDVYYLLASGGRLHIWQTNIPGPSLTLGGEAIEIAGRQWFRLEVDWGATLLEYHTTFEDGVTLTVDAPMAEVDDATLTEVAASIG